MDSELVLKIAEAGLAMKLLGPTVEYLGEELKSWTEKRRTNVGRIFEKAERKLGDRINEDGSVHPKILKEILEGGSFADDELAAEYFGGVLASSRTGISRDDRGAAFARLVAQLSTYQLRSHFYFYSLVKDLHNGSVHFVNASSGRQALEVFVPIDSYVSAMELMPEEDVSSVLTHVMWGLAKEGLIEGDFVTGSKEQIRRHFSEAAGAGLIFRPSALGVELFHWAHGLGFVPISDFLKPETIFESDVEIRRTPGPSPTRVNSG